MTTFLPPEIQAGLDRARHQAARPARRLRVEAGGQSYRVIRLWDDGFSLALDSMAAEHLRGRVDLYDGPRLVSQCLVIACEAQGHEIRFEYKRMTGASEEQPVDFVRHAPAPAGLLTAD